MTARQNLELHCEYMGFPNKERIDEVLHLVDLQNVEKKQVCHYSLGMKQRLAIARAILNDTKVIIFDEATSSLDNISQKVILQNIKPFLKNKVVIIVAHRLSTIKDADNIYIMNNGEVIEEGSHDELLLNKGAYFSMLNTKYIEEIAN